MNNDFQTIKRLVDFGMDSSAATHLVGTMNSLMSSMSIPGSMQEHNHLNNNSQPDASNYWYIKNDSAIHGPYVEKEILTLLLNKTITKDSLMWKYGMPFWAKASSLSEITHLVALLPPEI